VAVAGRLAPRAVPDELFIGVSLIMTWRVGQSGRPAGRPTGQKSLGYDNPPLAGVMMVMLGPLCVNVLKKYASSRESSQASSPGLY
jgi:hypothetical protein